MSSEDQNIRTKEKWIKSKKSVGSMMFLSPPDVFVSTHQNLLGMRKGQNVFPNVYTCFKTSTDALQHRLVNLSQFSTYYAFW